MGHLDEKRTALAEVQGKLQALNDDYDMKIIKKKVRYFKVYILELLDNVTTRSSEKFWALSSVGLLSYWRDSMLSVGTMGFNLRSAHRQSDTRTQLKPI